MDIQNFEYWYKAKVVSVYDGDTIRVTIDVGFGIKTGGSKGEPLRLYGIDTPELRGEEREQGIMVRDKLRELIDGKEVIIKTLKDKTGKYGRYLAIIHLPDGTNVNKWLLDNGYAKEYMV